MGGKTLKAAKSRHAGLYMLSVLAACLLVLPRPLLGDWQWENDVKEARVTAEEYSAVFTFRNTGKENLEVSNLQSCCNCTTHSYKSTKAKPGQAGTLTILIDRSKSKTSKKTFEFLAIGPSATPQKLEIRIPETGPTR